jgi:hypothetical protein
VAHCDEQAPFLLRFGLPFNENASSGLSKPLWSDRLMAKKPHGFLTEAQMKAPAKQVKAARKRLTRIQKGQFRTRMTAKIEKFLEAFEVEDLPVKPFRKLDVAFANWLLDGKRTDFTQIKRKTRRQRKRRDVEGVGLLTPKELTELQERRKHV